MRNISSKNRKAKRFTFSFLTLALVFIFFIKLGADNWPLDMGSAQPHFVGYRAVSMLNWSPETDPYADMLRSRVPLQTRIGHNKDTQINPDLNGKSEILLMQADYGNSFFNSTALNDTYAENVLQFWQYVDYWSPWHGAATAEVPSALYDPKTSDWRNRGFEFGLLNIPNPAYTDAAHRNGVKSIAILYVDPNFRPGQTVDEFFIKDENGRYIIADNMVKMANYYGFDGWFINSEEWSNKKDWDGFNNQLREQGMYVNYYDTNSSFNASKAENLKHSDSVFVNYGWSDKSSYEYAINNGYDPYKQVFVGVEANQGGFNGAHNSTKVEILYEDANAGKKSPVTSLALFTPSDMYQRDVKVEGSKGEYPDYQLPQFQWMVEERERMYFSGVKSNPTDTGRKAGFSRPDVVVKDASGWAGVADFAPARSVISGSNFYSDFNTGKGRQYFLNGQVSKDELWTNISLQSILPSWQWWVESTGDKLSVDYDYGTSDVRFDANNQAMTLPYEQVGAYNGGSSLVMYGKLSESNKVNLFKTDITVDSSSELNITYKKVSNDSAKMSVALQFEDSGNATELIALNNTEAAGNWVSEKVNLSAYAGRKIAKISLQIDGQSDKYQMNIGRLVISNNNVAAATPTGFKVDKYYHDGQLHLSWNLGSFDQVNMYEVYAKDSSGKQVFLGGNFNENIYVKNLNGLSGDITLQLFAISKNGEYSAPAEISLSRSHAAQNIQVKEILKENKVMMADEKGKINVSWNSPAAGNPDSYRITVNALYVPEGAEEKTSFQFDIDGSSVSESLDIPLVEGYRYDLTIESIVGGQSVATASYRGRLHDSYTRPYSAKEMELEKDNNGNESLLLHSPITEDWDKLEYYFEDLTTPAKVFVRAESKDFPNKRGLNLPKKEGLIQVILTDYSANRSEAILVQYKDGTLTELTELIDETDFPDAELLKAVKSQVGKYRELLKTYNGELDLVGLDVRDLSGLDKFDKLSSLKLGENPQLKEVKNLAKSLKNIELGELPELERLDLSGLALEKIDAKDISTSKNLKYVDISNNKLDLMEGTVERKFLDAVKKVLEGNSVGLAENLKFNMQRPIAYNDPKLPKELKYEVSEGTTYNVLEALKGDKTIRENNYLDLKGLQIDGQEVIAPDFVLEDNLSDYSAYTAKIFDSSTEMVNNPISAAKTETFVVSYFDPEGKLVGKTNYIIGAGKEIQEDLALDAKILGSNKDGDLERAFDGDITTQYKAWGWGREKLWLAFDIGESPVAEKWVLYSDKEEDPDGYVQNIKSARLEVLNVEATEEQLNDNAFLANAENWKTVGEFSGNTGFKVSGDLEQLTDRYYRFVIVESSGWNSGVVSELKIIGVRDATLRAKFKPEIKDVIIKEGEELDLEQGLVNKADLPAGTQINSKVESVNTEKAGKYTGQLELVFPDQSVKNVEITVFVTPRIDVDKGQLSEMIEKAKAIPEKGYTAASTQKLKDAIAEAEAIRDLPSASQSDVEEQIKKLTDTINKLEIYGVVSDENIALNKNVLAYNAYDGDEVHNQVTPGEEIGKVVDGDLKTKWSPGEVTSSGWFVLDLGQEYKLDLAKFHNAFPYERWNYNKGINTASASIEILREGVDPSTLNDEAVASNSDNWVEIAKFSNSEEDIAELDLRDASQRKARYIRVHILDSGTGGDYGRAIRLHEFELFGSIETPADKEKLQSKYDELNNIDRDKYTAESLSALDEALRSAKELLDSSTAQQINIDNEVVKLEAIEASLVLVRTVSFDLNYENAPAIASQKVANNSLLKDALPEEPVRSGYKFLRWTLDGLGLNGDEIVNKDITLIAEWEKLTDYTELRKLVAQAKEIKADDYTEESFAKLAEEISKAEKLLNDDTAAQEELDEAVAKLNEAIGKLEKVKYELTVKGALAKILNAEVIEHNLELDQDLFIVFAEKPSNAIETEKYTFNEIYDIKLENAKGEEVKANGTIKLAFTPKTNVSDNTVLVHETEAGLVEMSYEKEGNRISFTTDSFSNFGLGVKTEGKPFEPGKPAEPGKPNVPGQSGESGNTDKGKIKQSSKTPPTKTGVAMNIAPYLLTIVLLTAAFVIVVVRRKLDGKK